MTHDEVLKNATPRPWDEMRECLLIANQALAVLAVNAYEPMRQEIADLKVENRLLTEALQQCQLRQGAYEPMMEALKISTRMLRLLKVVESDPQVCAEIRDQVNSNEAALKLARGGK